MSGLKLKGEVPFPLSGEGNFINFSVLAMAKLEETYGVGDLFNELERGCNECSATVIMHTLDATLRKEEGGQKIPVKLDWENIDWPLAKAAPLIMDALCIAQTGQTYLEVVEEALKRRDEVEAEIQRRDLEAGEDPDNPFPNTEALEDIRPSVTVSDSAPEKSGT